MDDHRFKHPTGKKAVNWEGIFKTGIPLSTYCTKRSPEAIQMHASDLPEKIRSLNKTSPVNILRPRLGATKSPRGPQNNQRNKRYFFAYFRPAKANAKRARSAWHARQVKAFCASLCHACLKPGAAPRSLHPYLRSPENGKKSRLFCRQAVKRACKPSRSMTMLNRLDDFTRIFGEEINTIVILLDFHSTNHGLPLVDSWSRGLD